MPCAKGLLPRPHIHNILPQKVLADLPNLTRGKPSLTVTAGPHCLLWGPASCLLQSQDTEFVLAVWTLKLFLDLQCIYPNYQYSNINQCICQYINKNILDLFPVVL